MGGSVAASLCTAVGILMVFDGHRFGYFIAAFFGLCAIAWAARLLTPPEVMLDLPASHFCFFPMEAGAESRLCESRITEKPTHPSTEPSPAKSGVWDRELDHGL